MWVEAYDPRTKTYDCKVRVTRSRVVRQSTSHAQRVATQA